MSRERYCSVESVGFDLPPTGMKVLCFYSKGTQIFLFMYTLYVGGCNLGFLVRFSVLSLHLLLVRHFPQYQMRNPAPTFVCHTHSFDLNMNRPFCLPLLEGILPKSPDVF
jgi:hypothetical protein